MINDLDRRLLDKARFEAVIDRLVERAVSEPSKLGSAPVDRDFSLSWVLAQRELVYKRMREFLADPEFRLGATRATIVVTNKAREIYVNSWPDRVLLMMTARLISEVTNSLVPPCVYSFRKGVGPFNALNALADFMRRDPTRGLHVLKRDVSKYGDSIPQRALLDRLGRDIALDNNPIVRRLIEQAIRARVLPPPNTEGAAEYSLCVGVPSGSPLVPPLENYYLIPLDRALMNVPNSFYARYGDDFVFATHDESVAREADATIERVIAELGLHIKPEKKLDAHLLAHQSTGIEWLGRHVNANGRMGFKSERARELRLHLKGEIRELIARAQGFFGTRPAMRAEMFRNGLHELLTEDLATNVHLRDFVHSQTNLALVRQLERSLCHWIVKYLQSGWQLGKRDAWRELRRAKLPSLMYARHRHLRNRRQHAKSLSRGTERKAA